MDATDPNTTHHCAYTYGADGLRRSQAVSSESVATPIGGGELNAVGGDPDGGLVAALIPTNTTHYAYDGTMLVREMKPVSGSLTPTATYFQGASGPAYRRDDTQGEGTYTDGTGTHVAGKTRWYVYDGLGSVVGEVDPSGNLTSSGTYDVYGAKRAGGGTGSSSTRQSFVGSLGHVTDTETGLVYMRARYYDPQTGRFVSEDQKLQGNNWFVYAGSNPTNCVDQTGQAWLWINHVEPDSSFGEEMMEAFKSGGRQGLADFFEEHWGPNVVNFSEGTNPGIVGRFQLLLKINEVELEEAMLEDAGEFGMNTGFAIDAEAVGGLIEGAASADMIDMEL